MKGDRGDRPLIGYWDAQRASSFVASLAMRRPGVVQAIGRIQERLPVGSLLLDAGCGPGFIASLLSPRYRVIGLDHSPAMLGNARDHVAAAVAGDVFAPPVKEGCLDAASTFCVLSDYVDPLPALQALIKGLRPGGWFFWVDYGPGDGWWTRRMEYRDSVPAGPIYLRSPREMEELCRAAGAVPHLAETLPYDVPLEAELWEAIRHRGEKMGLRAGDVLGRVFSFLAAQSPESEDGQDHAGDESSSDDRSRRVMSAIQLAEVLVCPSCRSSCMVPVGEDAFRCPAGCGQWHNEAGIWQFNE